VFFAIASLALSVVLFTFIVNWDYVGGARGAYVLQPREVPFACRATSTCSISSWC